jgi:hypothetical protein
VAVTLNNVTQQIQDGVVHEIRARLDGSPDIRRVSIYSGYGFCSILVKAQVLDYYGIPEVPNWIGTEFRALGASTETFLVHNPAEMAGDESIGRTTFQAIKGKNLFVRSIIPEVYEAHESVVSRAEEIQTFLMGMAHESDLKPRDKKLLHDYLLPYLRDNPADMAKTIFTFCAELEGFLRKRCEEFIGRSGSDLKTLCEKLGISKDRRRHFTLDQLLNLCSLAIRETGKPASAQKDWQPLAQLRNDVAHGDFDLMSDWQTPAKVLVDCLPGVRDLTRSILDVLPLRPGESSGEYL